MTSPPEQITEIIVASSFILLAIFTLIIYLSNGDAPHIKKAFWSILVVFALLRGLYFAIPDSTLNSDYRPTADKNIDKDRFSKHWWLSLIDISLQIIPDYLLYVIFSLFLAFMASVFNLIFRPSIAELGDTSGSKIIESPVIYRYYVRFMISLSISFIALLTLHFFFITTTIELIEKCSCVFFSIVLAVGFILYHLFLL